MSNKAILSANFAAITFISLSIILSSVSAEAKLSQTEVSQLYASVFNRASEGEGNTYWQSEPDMATAATAMLNTDAAKNYFGASLNSNQAFIEHVYRNTLNKTLADDPAGIAYWVGELNTKSRGQVVASLVGVIKNYAPGGPYYNANDAKTIDAYNQFTNRVLVSDYMANTVAKTPANWATATQFSATGLNVTANAATVTLAKTAIDIIANDNPSGLKGAIEEYMTLFSSVGDFSSIMDEISIVLGEVMDGNSPAVTIIPSLADLDLASLPSSITITANFGDGYTPKGSSSIFTGVAVIMIENLTYSATGISADATITATNVRRDGQLILNGGMTLGLNIRSSGSDMAVVANINFSNMQSLDFQINGEISASLPSINIQNQTFQPMVITVNQLTTNDMQLSGTVTLTQKSTSYYEAYLYLITNQGSITGSIGLDMSNPERFVITTPDTLSVDDYLLDFNNVILDPATCSTWAVGGNIVITGSSETGTLIFNSNCSYTIN